MTSRRLRWFEAGVRRHKSWQTSSSLRRMRRSGQIESDPTLRGDPHLDIHGSIRVGAGLTIVSRPVTTHLIVHRGAHLEIAQNVTIGPGCGVSCHSHISIGPGTVIDSGVLILDSDYHVAGSPEVDAIPVPISIGAGVHIGENATVLSGAHIGDKAQIAPDSVVSGFVAPGAKAAGVPARSTKPVLLGPRAADDDVEQSVLVLAQEVFGMPDIPSLTEGPGEIANWDSLGSLSFLLALEQEFNIAFNVDDTVAVRSLHEVAVLIRRSAV